ncbi:hypothetical protein ACJJTC_015585 [Scirpophaga incertulas]
MNNIKNETGSLGMHISSSRPGDPPAHYRKKYPHTYMHMCLYYMWTKTPQMGSHASSKKRLPCLYQTELALHLLMLDIRKLRHTDTRAGTYSTHKRLTKFGGTREVCTERHPRLECGRNSTSRGAGGSRHRHTALTKARRRGLRPAASELPPIGGMQYDVTRYSQSARSS